MFEVGFSGRRKKRLPFSLAGIWLRDKEVPIAIRTTRLIDKPKAMVAHRDQRLLPKKWSDSRFDL